MGKDKDEVITCASLICGVLFMSFGRNYRNQVIAGILSDVLQNLPTLHPKWGAAPGDSRSTDKCASMLGKSAKNAIDNNSDLW